MSEPKLFIENNLNDVVAWSKFGVIWRIEPAEKLGSFYGDVICDSTDNQIAKAKGNEVFNIEGKKLGEVKDVETTNDNGVEIPSKLLIINGQEAGVVKRGDEITSLAAIALLGSELVR